MVAQAFKNVVVHYFPARGRAEPVRMALASKGITWTEATVDFAAMKTDFERFTFGQAPMFEFDGFHLVQSNAALRYVGKKLSLYGESDEEAAEIDMYLDAISDARNKIVHLHYFDKYLPEGVQSFLDTHVKPETVTGRTGGFHVAHWDRIVKSKGCGFLVGGKLSIADVDVVCLLEHILDSAQMAEHGITAAITESYPSIATYVANVKSAPGIKEYVASPTRFAA